MKSMVLNTQKYAACASPPNSIITAHPNDIFSDSDFFPQNMYSKPNLMQADNQVAISMSELEKSLITQKSLTDILNFRDPLNFGESYESTEPFDFRQTINFGESYESTESLIHTEPFNFKDPLNFGEPLTSTDSLIHTEPSNLTEYQQSTLEITDSTENVKYCPNCNIYYRNIAHVYRQPITENIDLSKLLEHGSEIIELKLNIINGLYYGYCIYI
jgi:hypothetical protein